MKQFLMAALGMLGCITPVLAQTIPGETIPGEMRGSWLVSYVDAPNMDGRICVLQVFDNPDHPQFFFELALQSRAHAFLLADKTPAKPLVGKYITIVVDGTKLIGSYETDSKLQKEAQASDHYSTLGGIAPDRKSLSDAFLIMEQGKEMEVLVQDTPSIDQSTLRYVFPLTQDFSEVEGDLAKCLLRQFKIN